MSVCFKKGIKLFELKEINFIPSVLVIEDEDEMIKSKDNILYITLGKYKKEGKDYYHINFWYELKFNWFNKFWDKCDMIFIPNKNFEELINEKNRNKIQILKRINKIPENIKNYYISKVINHVEYNFKSYLKLERTELDSKEPILFFGLYNVYDLNNLLKYKGEIHLIFGGSDLDNNQPNFKIIIPKLKKIVKQKKIKIYYISKNLYNRGEELKLGGSLVELNYCKRMEHKINGDGIYIYDGYNKRGKMYNLNLVDELKVRLKRYNLISSSELCCDSMDIYDYYKKIFIGVRLTDKDGNANTVNELNSMGIPVIFNGASINGISYNDIDDIVKKIEYWKKNINMIGKKNNLFDNNGFK